MNTGATPPARPPGGSGGDRNRSYIFDSDDLRRLFVGIIESLGTPGGGIDIVDRILGDVCRHFRFGCGFVYEADHTGAFFLKEHFLNYPTNKLPGSFTPWKNT